jgi:predicted nucleotidyltransferase
MERFPPLTSVPSLAGKLEAQLRSLREALAAASIAGEFQEVLVIGSVSRGEATYRSDIDLLFILREGPLNYSRVQDLRDRLEHQVLEKVSERALPVQAQFVLPSVRETREPAMRSALKAAWPLLHRPEAA